MPATHQNSNIEDRILEVAKQMFIENGFEETSMSDIAIKVGINRPALHYYFRTKTKMFQAVLGQIIQSLVPRLQDVLQQRDRPLPERIGDVVDIYYQLFKENPCLPLFVMREMKRDANCLLKAAKSYHLDNTARIIIDCLQEEQEQGKIAHVPIRFIFFTFYSMLTFPFTMKDLCSIVFLDDGETFNQMLDQWKPYVVRQMSLLLAPPTA